MYLTIMPFYLPFNLEFIGGGDVWEMVSCMSDGSILLANGVSELTVEHNNIGLEYLPILRPMRELDHSSLLKEIDKEFEHLLANPVCGDSENVLCFENQELGISAGVMAFIKMLEKHFDLFGMIKNKKAVDYYSIYPSHL